MVRYCVVKSSHLIVTLEQNVSTMFGAQNKIEINVAICKFKS